MATRTIADLAEQVKTDATLQKSLQDDPVGTLQRESQAAYMSDPQFYRIAIIGLIGIIVLVILSGLIVQIWKDTTISDWQSALATTALGGLVGLFAPSPTGE